MERFWIVPATILTAAMAAATRLLAPADADFGAAFSLFPLWLLFGLIMYGGLILARTFTLMRRGETEPLRTLRWELRPGGVMIFGFLLAGLNLITFMWAKPLLNHFVPFWADPWLDAADRALLLGHRASVLLSPLNSDVTAAIYHRGWFALLTGTLIYVLARPPSREKSALMLTFFLLWSVAGPFVHMAMPAGGPIFYQRLVHQPYPVVSAPITASLADVLWGFYTRGNFGPAAGISAMPSLHIATVAWATLACRRSIALWPVAALSFFIFLLSMSLGWHYMVDGIVGGALAVFTYVISRRALRLAEGSGSDVRMEPAAAALAR